MNESGVWHTLSNGMKGLWHATRLESSAGNGVPDVSFGVPGVNGFIELKHIKTWPVLSSTAVKLPLKPEQKLWISIRGQITRNVWVLCRIEDSFALLTSFQAIRACEGLYYYQWKSREFTRYFVVDRIDFKELYKILKAGY